ncbi:MAG TPA: ABC transporter permease subunit [Acidimicrobiia bacterium]|nr:ABC transporter permease subunit [Acidimicrobiia bacterium]
MTTTVDTAPSGRALSAEELRLQKQRRRDRISRISWRIAGYVVVLSSWELASGTILNERLYPAPTKILATFGEIWASGRLPESFAATLTRLGIGFSLAFVLGALIGLVTQARWWEGFFKDSILVSLTAPGLVWALTGIIIWGFDAQGWIFAIVMTTFGLVSVNVAAGIKALPKDLLDMAKAFRVGTLTRQREIVIPHLAPFLFTAVRYGFSVGWKVTVLTELFTANKGIGFEMRVATQLFRLDEFFTWVLSFFVFALFLEKVVLQYFERRFFRWRPEVTA